MFTSQLAEQEALNGPSLEKASARYSATLRSSTRSSSRERSFLPPQKGTSLPCVRPRSNAGPATPDDVTILWDGRRLGHSIGQISCLGEGEDVLAEPGDARDINAVVPARTPTAATSSSRCERMLSLPNRARALSAASGPKPACRSAATRRQPRRTPRRRAGHCRWCRGAAGSTSLGRWGRCQRRVRPPGTDRCHLGA